MEISKFLEKMDHYYQKNLKEHEFLEEYSDITYNIFLYLRKINSLGNPTISELAKAMEVSKPSASNMVSKMVDKGLLKTKASPKDGRACLLELTDKGKRVIEIESWADMKFIEKIREILDEEEFGVLERIFEKIASGLEEEKA
ncbi:MarR family winged helix-turn-helix transcriptional regulator [Methanosarcina sp. UBA411]|jgi:DNA-binding MarR family transcriptional regulator|uniref:MarR family winged helix-turn-helix transcriptional regulator n=1 Tax=Methanosarcina sp. UBA411 TaxID=1915589 RepID=UPI0025D928E8|nr:MarR family transcriptional regulator [Methanosarcina sp. UBA411]